MDKHPGAEFYVVLVDKNEGYINPEEERFNLLEMTDVGLPRPDIFPYQYNILELNTAVKPFALKYLLETHGFDKITYIDPDIMVFSPLDDVWDNLEDNSVVLTPHMREPFDDGRHPSELGIIQSGTYNLGFIGLKNGTDAIKLLNWWSERLYLDCVVDIPRGLFTDQKWIDLVPAYFDKTYILRNPAYNIAYWNLHERELTLENGSYMVDGNALAFFHFSGYDPRKPKVLSKHQDRHDLLNYPDLTHVFDLYGSKLLEANLIETKEWPYAYKNLPNGVEVTDAMTMTVRECLRKHILFPSPINEADKFCDFLMTPNRKIFGENVAPFISALLRKRPDVAQAFPDAHTNRLSPSLWDWLENNTHEAWKFTGLFSPERKNLACSDSIIENIVDTYFSRSDLVEAIPSVFKNTKRLNEFCDWLVEHGISEYDWLSLEGAQAFSESTSGAYKAIALYFSRPDLQGAFPAVYTEHGINAYVAWLHSNVANIVNLSDHEIDFFAVWVKLNSDKVMKACLIYSQVLRTAIGGLPSVFNANSITETLKTQGLDISVNDVLEWLTQEFEQDPIEHLISYYYSNPRLIRKNYLETLNSGSLQQLFDVIDKDGLFELLDAKWVRSLKKAIESYQPDNSVNVVGYFDAATGMGQAAHSVKLTMQQKHQVNTFTLPLLFTDRTDIDFDECGKFFGKAKLSAATSIVVANADSVEQANAIFPTDYVFGKKIGYWLWETEKLPGAWAHSDRFYDEVWTASDYCKKAIQSTITKPVKTVPLCLNFDEFKEIQGVRSEFDLPEDAFLVGYFFDQKSVFERKNPKAVIDAFNQGLGNENNAFLIMKVNSPLPGLFEYEKLKEYAKDSNVIWVEKTLSRKGTLELMSCLDTYISLHRSEGFGLTMAEAMALGIPTIATNYSSNTEFMDDEHSYLVDIEMVHSPKAYGPYPKGTKWANPLIDSAASKLKAAKNSPVEASDIKSFIHQKLSSHTAYKFIK
ncbi:hypothetical protein GCM10011369_20460 [Neiella marina]|uniref:Glycosyl transferase family 1 domain-containing protein n=1 Tax=Neiella marina TaxID=508461 RepID=A0A8J2U5G6_9GAMM|nr:glycosyltransferase [Neiella marina]GGA78477.1 hypothetical protein GCM10011369_20460 [Neiella marina]